ncbi:hypothetical protein [Alkalihalobacillus sp. AL-G]|uniref:hypothetical protein n=1 Tax=Alkalihalobacillus sp. AL-G TaxID=2926399 RepID=UPI00272C9B7E|nr:hypothetical protein [Alkalihalobacillus sp. AL-G]WLD92636.1 hypothetical protein MOJ78_16700 [Alkalihalobacillus sp. AL-G]
MITNNQWTRYFHSVYPESDKKVKEVTVDFLAVDIDGTVHLSDIQVQGGPTVTAYRPSNEDILQQLTFSIDETDNAQGNDVYEGEPPEVYPNVRNRFFNICGRGHDVVVVPNVFHEDYTKELLTTGLDLTLYPKDDYDLLKISTNYGTLLPKEEQQYGEINELTGENHPLHFRYTREFFFPGGETGDEIRLMSSIRNASINGKRKSLGQYEMNIGGQTFQIDKQRFFALPSGSIRFRVEFYKLVTESLTHEWEGQKPVSYMKDTGIGYWGLAEFTQWSEGRSKM